MVAFILAGILGAIIGSFLNAWTYRLEASKSILAGRSQCPNCNRILGVLELIPVYSYLAQRGRCKGCGWKIPFQYIALEIITAGLFVFAVWQNTASGQSACFNFFDVCIGVKVWRDFVFLSALLVIFVFDLKHNLIADTVVLPTAAFAFIWNFAFGASLYSLLLGVLIPVGFFGAQYLLSRGIWIGEGDIRLGAAIGAMLGFPLIILALFISYITGAVAGLAMILMGKANFKSAVPFGVFLALGTAFSLYYGEPILRWYFNRLGI
ncbi:prepilin peptidase [Candidatus Uhrbacteria bacterium]|nr:prepilin peptidase [Candidatus Uhrbacteria bacterium]